MPEARINTGFRHFNPVSRQPSLSSFGAKPLSSPPVLLSDIVTYVATNRIYTGFSPHLHCRTQKRPCQSGRNSEPTRSFSYTYLLRVLPQISFSSQTKVFAPNEDKSFAPRINPLFKLPFAKLLCNVFR